MRNKRRNTSSGHTLVELLVSLAMFEVIGLGLFSFVGSALHTIGVEGRASEAAQELREALEVMTTELRMSSGVSPYIVGTSPSSVTCSSAVSVTSTKVKFMVAQDESTASSSGLQTYYVGYWYDSSKKQLLRGEIQSSSNTSCVIPAGDPTSSSIAKVIAENVIAIDGDGNGTVDPAFSVSGNSIAVNLGVQIDAPNGDSIVQAMPTSILRRTP